MSEPEQQTQPPPPTPPDLSVIDNASDDDLHAMFNEAVSQAQKRGLINDWLIDLGYNLNPTRTPT